MHTIDRTRQRIAVSSLAAARLDAAMELLHGCLWETDADGRLSYLTDSAVAFADKPLTWYLGRTLEEIGVFKSDSEVAAAVSSGMAAHEPFGPFVLSRTLKDGSVVWARSWGRPRYDENGTYQGYRGIFSDVTGEMVARHKKEKLEQRIRESHELLRATVDCFPIAMCVFDDQHRLAAANERYYQLLDLPVDRFGQGCRFDDIMQFLFERGEFIHGGLTELVVETAGATSTEIIERRRPNGRMLSVRSASLPRGGFVRAYADITDHVLQNKKLEATAAQLRESHGIATLAAATASEMARARFDFLANLSHEVRTPLNGIVGMLGLLLETPLGEDQQGFARGAFDAGQMLLVIVNNVLEHARLEAGAVEIESVEFDPEKVIDATIAYMKAQVAFKGLKIERIVDPSLPRSLRGDPFRLRQVLFNLAGNAVKFTERGSVRLSCHVEKQQAGSVEIAFSISDTGIGISREVQARLFQRFSQADIGTASRYGGTGLGLAISRELVRLMGGEIDCTSSLGSGSTFRFTIICPHHAEIGAPASSRPAQERRTPSRRRILVVDDNPPNLRLLHSTLLRWNHDVDTARDGHEAIAAVSKASYDLVILDLQMPGLDGAETAAIIRSLPGDKGRIPIMGLTASMLPQDHTHCLASGMNWVFLKPVDDNVLETIIAGFNSSTPDQSATRAASIDRSLPLPAND